MTDLLVPIRAIHFGAVLWLFGELAFFVFVLRPDLRSIPVDMTANRQRERRLVRVAAGSTCRKAGPHPMRMDDHAQ